MPASLSPPAAVVFDIGNVLLRFDFDRALNRIAPDCTVPLAEVPAAWEPVKRQYESGRIGRRDFLNRAIEAAGYCGPESVFIEAWNDIFTENEPMTAIVRTLHGRLPLFLLSNTNDLHLDFIRTRFSVFELLPKGIYSWEAGCMKPEPEIFRIAVERLGLDPERTVYIDDLEPNIATAREFGFRWVHYHPDRHEMGAERLRACGLPV